MLDVLLAVIPVAVILELLTTLVWAQAWADRGINVASLTSNTDRVTRTLLACAVGTLVATHTQSLAATAAFTAAAWLTVIAVTTDLESGLIPREACWLTFTAIAGFALTDLTATTVIIDGVLSVAVTAIALIIIHALKFPLGGGDARLLLAWAPLGAWLGPTMLLTVVTVAALVQMASRRWLPTHAHHDGGHPFAPALAVGLTVTTLAALA